MTHCLLFWFSYKHEVNTRKTNYEEQFAQTLRVSNKIKTGNNTNVNIIIWVNRKKKIEELNADIIEFITCAKHKHTQNQIFSIAIVFFIAYHSLSFCLLFVGISNTFLFLFYSNICFIFVFYSHYNHLRSEYEQLKKDKENDIKLNEQNIISKKKKKVCWNIHPFSSFTLYEMISEHKWSLRKL
ncbi:hypothetical protein RFI_34123 [Reticulomyxa filosa]|uniref:Uncharacterized protein n=1 Tax=Reticulomyxa filosa TaxID=46433 RepID=X6LPI7_RETFI|nr:hypothetical protein RFI_34123 [Reticulomyxa filosa]|eukprot:ETO03286.1 hypothetical protein RFI_34123 [Reticulomyxa filosa]